MRLAIISDIHGNLPALEAVLADVDASAPDEVWCLGDVVGYGAEPNECAELVAERCTVCLAGNHDLAVLEAIDISTFSPAAAEAAQWTTAQLADGPREFLSGLHAADESREVALYHASPRDHVWEYVLWPEQAGECIAKQAKRVALIGHSHIALCFRAADDGDADATEGAQVNAGTKLEIGDGRWLLNPGSVGQPRDRDPRACYGIFDSEERTFKYFRVAYDVQTARQKILDAGLAPVFGERLLVGM